MRTPLTIVLFVDLRSSTNTELLRRTITQWRRLIPSSTTVTSALLRTADDQLRSTLERQHLSAAHAGHDCADGQPPLARTDAGTAPVGPVGSWSSPSSSHSLGIALSRIAGTTSDWVSGYEVLPASFASSRWKAPMTTRFAEACRMRNARFGGGEMPWGRRLWPARSRVFDGQSSKEACGRRFRTPFRAPFRGGVAGDDT